MKARILKSTVKMELETTRLLLKPTTEKDFDILFKIITNEYVRKYLFDNQVLGKDKVGEFLATSINSFQSKHYGLWLISPKNELNKIIGFVGLWDFFEEPQPQLLYAILPESTSQGFASEASNEIIRYTFQKLGFNYLTLSCDTPNVPSHKVAERIGMKKFKEELVNGRPLTFYRMELSY
jgi:ribosomal-protein-alanine N-acetyltransferase